MQKTVYIHTFGCQMNVHDSEKMLGILEKQGYVPTCEPAEADLIIFNTCSIRQKAEQKFFSELGRVKSLKKTKPGLKIAVAGCTAQQEGGNIFKRAPHVDFVFGPQNLHILDGLSGGYVDAVSISDNPLIAIEDLPMRRTEGVKAWVTIMYGCNNFCSYCVVPYVRGREGSRPSRNIYKEVSALAAMGYREITLLGQNVNSYSSDNDFTGLLRNLDRIDGIDRIRFVTSHPKDLSLDLIIAMAELPKLCEHIHLPLQSGSSAVLDRMNRKYSYEEYKEKVGRLRSYIPDISITSDIIAGFPGETEDDHLLTMKAIKDIEFDGIFAFKFSPRRFTKAAEMSDHIPESVKSGRLNEILKIQDDITLRKNKSLVGTVQEILIEGESETDRDKLTGRTRSNKIVTVQKTDALNKGTYINVRISRARKHSLEGRPV
jgi:tRNA-2-methylthio-N6-dimethylallyladenosine synthase